MSVFFFGPGITGVIYGYTFSDVASIEFRTPLRVSLHTGPGTDGEVDVSVVGVVEVRRTRVTGSKTKPNGTSRETDLGRKGQ